MMDEQRGNYSVDSKENEVILCVEVKSVPNVEYAISLSLTNPAEIVELMNKLEYHARKAFSKKE